MKALHDYLKNCKPGKEFTIYDVCPEAKTDKQIYNRIASSVALFCKPSNKRPIPTLRKVSRGVYVYNVTNLPTARVKKDAEKLERAKARKAAKRAMSDDDEPVKKPGEDGFGAVLGALAKSSGTLELLVNNKIEFNVKFKCSNVERNFHGDVTRFSIECVDVSVCSIINKKQ